MVVKTQDNGHQRQGIVRHLPTYLPTPSIWWTSAIKRVWELQLLTFIRTPPSSNKLCPPNGLALSHLCVSAVNSYPVYASVVRIAIVPEEHKLYEHKWYIARPAREGVRTAGEGRGIEINNLVHPIREGGNPSHRARVEKTNDARNASSIIIERKRLFIHENPSCCHRFHSFGYAIQLVWFSKEKRLFNTRKPLLLPPIQHFLSPHQKHGATTWEQQTHAFPTLTCRRRWSELAAPLYHMNHSPASQLAHFVAAHIPAFKATGLARVNIKWAVQVVQSDAFTRSYVFQILPVLLYQMY